MTGSCERFPRHRLLLATACVLAVGAVEARDRPGTPQRNASRPSALSTPAASAAAMPAPVAPEPPFSLGQQPPIDVPNFGAIAPNVPAHVTASRTSQAAPAATDTRGSPQRSGDTRRGGPAMRSTSAQGLPGSNVPPPQPDVGLLGGLGGLPNGFPWLPNGQVPVKAPMRSTTSTATAAVVAPNTVASRGSDERAAIATDGPSSRSTTTRAPGSTPPPPQQPTPNLGNLGMPSWVPVPQLPGQATPPPATPSSRSTSVAVPGGLPASSVATTRSAIERQSTRLGR